MDEYFKFIIKLPRYEADSFGEYQTAAIVTQAPMLYMRWSLSNNLSDEDSIRLAKAELKMMMIEAIMKGEWEIETI